MRRIPPVFSLTAVALLLTACYAVWGQCTRPAAQEPTRPAAAKPSRPACCCPQTATAESSGDKLVEGLVAILNETNSPDTMVVTIQALADVGCRARAAVPAIIRNAERVGLLKDILLQGKDDDGPGLVVVDAIEEILRGRQPEPAPGAYPPVLSGATPPVSAYAPVVPASGRGAANRLSRKPAGAGAPAPVCEAQTPPPQPVQPLPQ